MVHVTRKNRISDSQVIVEEEILYANDFVTSKISVSFRQEKLGEINY